MNVVGSAAAIAASKLHVTKQENEKGVSSLNFYAESPDYELSLDDFEDYALKRLKVLRLIEKHKMMRVPAEKSRLRLEKTIKEEKLTDPKIDQASHFILRLSYCQSEDLRRWFLQHECALFQHRLQSLSDIELAKSVRQYAQVKPITSEEKERLKDKLMQLINMNPGTFGRTSFYAVPFSQVLDLVKTRQCYLHKGSAYVPQDRVLSILITRFRTMLSRQLAMMAASGMMKSSSSDPETTRIFPLLKNLSHCLVNSDESSSSLQHGLQGDKTLNAATVSQLTPNMPLCMRQLHAGLVQDKKLKHWGRLQYGLFLKGAGLSMDDALLFFQRHFSKVTGETFQKQYAYNIRHMYGKEGKRANYTPYNCSKIIHGNAAPASSGDHHGCPYKHYDQQHLSLLLQKLNIGTTPAERDEIVRLAKKEHQYQLACLKHFEVQHPGVMSMDNNGVSVDNVGNHPNAWFRASVMYHEKKKQSSDPTNSSGGGGAQFMSGPELNAISP